MRVSIVRLVTTNCEQKLKNCCKYEPEKNIGLFKKLP